MTDWPMRWKRFDIKLGSVISLASLMGVVCMTFRNLTELGWRNEFEYEFVRSVLVKDVVAHKLVKCGYSILSGTPLELL
jgi:hypothetical protein